MQDHYKTLGIQSSATVEEIRRAYRILARRYHPDLNPGSDTEEKFKTIAAAYKILGDVTRREVYDQEYERLQFDSLLSKFKGGSNAQQAGRRTPGFGKGQPEYFNSGAVRREVVPDTGIFAPIKRSYRRYRKKLSSIMRSDAAAKPGAAKPAPAEQSRKISIIEVSVSVKDAIFGVKKTIEIPEPEGVRKVSVVIPPGVRAGSVVRMAQEKNKGRSAEELVIIVRVPHHPFVSIQTKGLVVEVPVSVVEALMGASISLPTLDEPAVVKIPSGSQTGTEIRLKGKGIKLKDGTRGDIVYRLNVRIPESANAVGIAEKASEFEKYYESAPRKGFPTSILEF